MDNASEENMRALKEVGAGLASNKAKVLDAFLASLLPVNNGP
jgi:hypothetical protein